jgi:hypothetical protein
MKQLNLFEFPKDTGTNDNVIPIDRGSGYKKNKPEKVIPILRIHRPREERLEQILHSGKNDSAGKDQWD